MVIGRTGAPALGALLLASVVVTGCADDKQDGTTQAGEPQAEGSETTTAGVSGGAEDVLPPDLVDPPTFQARGGQGESARKDVTIDKCEAKEGPQVVRGEITSTAEAKTDYLVTIHWVNGSNVMGRGFALVRGVEPGKETAFEVRTDVKRRSTACTVNVQRGTIDEASLRSTAPAAPSAPAVKATATAAATTR